MGINNVVDISFKLGKTALIIKARIKVYGRLFVFAWVWVHVLRDIRVLWEWCGCVCGGGYVTRGATHI